MRVLFYGSPDYTSAFLDSLSACAEVVGVVTASDKGSGRGQLPHRPAPALWAEGRALPLFQAPDLRDEGFAEGLRGLKPDLGVVAAYGRILPRAIFALPKHGTINVHFSLLPKYRGASPIESALLDGAAKSGVSVQRITEELDAGDVLESLALPIDPLDHFPELFAKLMDAALTLLPRCVGSIEAGTARFAPQDAARASYCGKIGADARRIDWQKGAETVYNQIRACAGGRTAWTTIQGKKIFLHRAEPVEEERPAGTIAEPAGMVMRRGGKALVPCGDGRYVSLVEVQVENKRRVPAALCLNGLRLREGECFV